MARNFINLDDKKRVVLTDSDMLVIKENPNGLTKEGAKVEFNEWMKKSKNRYMQARYASMLKNCKVFTNSGKLKDGRTILSRFPVMDKDTGKPTNDLNGEPKWCEWLDTDMNRLTRRQWEALPEEKRN
jgi:hypothetical protein